ncbi:hypothetical protein SeMB42_g04577 [Synchytrium endobioticum]|uniref:Calcium-transporting ATPase 2 n=1 Tax=Synchytrium endobioticum TaxID=286115 RepID=A0A507CXQ1_9FUNG|nr:hypothetical protein SeLEV6574_g06962 [Synchytrium endobioticum]TPX43821.1 hypothetical protein SeMB42_g04577 [Synchytrium endobioticum]
MDPSGSYNARDNKLPPLKATTAHLPPIRGAVAVTAPQPDDAIPNLRAASTGPLPLPPIDTPPPARAEHHIDHIDHGPLTANAPFVLTADDLGRLVDFDRRNDGALLKSLEAHGGVDGIASKLNVSLARGLNVRPHVAPSEANHRKVSPAPSTEASLLNTFVVDAVDRRKAYGANLTPPPRSETILELVWGTIVEDPIIKILIVGAIVVISLGSAIDPGRGWIDGIAILIAVVLVLSVTAGNDYSKDKKFKKLLLLQSDKRTRVLRAGIADQVSSWDVLVGDLVVLEVGDEVPADGLFVRGNRLILDESPLTGESLPVKKSCASPFMFSGCQVAEGSGVMLVTAVGPRSSGGQIQELLNEAQTEETVLQQKLGVVAVFIGKVGVAAGLFTFIGLAIQWGVQWAQDRTGHAVAACIVEKGEVLCRVKELAEFFVVGITIIVVAVPEGLPLAVTISLAFSMFKMIKEKCFVRHLDASETMGEATCICTDKTGTLTENRMAVVKTYVGDKAYNGHGSAEPDAAPFSTNTFNENVRDLLSEGIAVNSTCLIRQRDNGGQPAFIGSATEGALLVFSSRLGSDHESIRENAIKADNGLWTFSSSRKRMSTLVIDSNVIAPGSNTRSKYRLHTKGASEIVLGLCKRYVDRSGSNVLPLTGDTMASYQRIIKTWASEGLRTLALAYRDSDVPLASNDATEGEDEETPEYDLTLIGIVGIKDPVRREVPGAVAQCQRAGLVVRMVTGDNVLTACKIAKECGIFTENGIALEGPVFRAMDVSKQLSVIPRLQVLARSSPADKHTLVTLLKEMGEVVAVTGDGTNDAPALKEADVGFAMGISGTQIAMNASDIVLLDDNFVSLVSAIKWGRNVLNCVRKFLQFQLAVNLVAVVLTFVGSMTIGTPPLNTVQLLWVNLIMDTLGALALASDEPDDDILLKPPHARTESLISKPMREYITIQLFFQLMVLLGLLLRGDDWVPYDRNFHTPDDLDEPGPSVRTTTMVFAVFVLLQVTNETMARQLNGELNIFSNIFRNKLFLLIMALIVVIQVLVIEFGGEFVGNTKLDWKEWLVCVVLALLNMPFTVISRAAIKHAQGKLFNKREDHVSPVESDQTRALAKSSVIDMSRSRRNSGNRPQPAVSAHRRASLTVRSVNHGNMHRPHLDGRRMSLSAPAANHQVSQTLGYAPPNSQSVHAHNIHTAVVLASVQRNLNKSLASLRDGSDAGKGGSMALTPGSVTINVKPAIIGGDHYSGSNQLVASSAVLDGSPPVASFNGSNHALYLVERGYPIHPINKSNSVIDGISRSGIQSRSSRASRNNSGIFASSAQQLGNKSGSQSHISGQRSSSRRPSKWATLRAASTLMGGLSAVRQADYISGQGPNDEFIQTYTRYSYIPNPVRDGSEMHQQDSVARSTPTLDEIPVNDGTQEDMHDERRREGPESH